MADTQNAGTNPSAHKSSFLETLSKSRLSKLLGLWLALVAVLFLPYLGIYLMGFRFVDWWSFLLGTIPIAITIVLLLEMDKHEQQRMERAGNEDGTQMELHKPELNAKAMAGNQRSADDEKKQNSMSVSELIYRLFVRRKSLVALFVVCTLLAVLVTYRFISALFSVEYEGEAGIVVHLPGETVYYIPVYPYSSNADSLQSAGLPNAGQTTGWQNTGIEIQADDEFTFEVSGMVSPGHLQNTPAMTDWTDKSQKYWDCKMTNPSRDVCGELPVQPALKWPFTGSEGYHADWYPNPIHSNAQQDIRMRKEGHKYINRAYQDDEGLTIQGIPHNWVIGVIRPEGHQPENHYDFAKDKAMLVNFSCKQRDYPREYKAAQPGFLWVVINDADAYRWDNEGWFLLKLTKHLRGLPSKRYRGPCVVPSPT
jgi:hypothetical protein